MGDSGPAHEVDTFSSRADDLRLGKILPGVHSRDSRLHGVPVSIVSDRDLEVYGILLEEFPKGYWHTADDEYSVPPSDRWSV